MNDYNANVNTYKAYEQRNRSAAPTFAYTAQLNVLPPRVKSSIQPTPLCIPLSSRESEVIRMLADGLSNIEIANRLYLSVGTVKWHLKQIYRKLGVKSRTKAIAKAQKLALL